MNEISLRCCVDAEDIAFAVAELDIEDVGEFAAQLIAALDNLAGDQRLDAFVKACAARYAELVAMREPLLPPREGS